MATYKGDWKTRESDEQGYAWTAFTKFFGREPTDAELARATAAYKGGDRNLPNVAGGDAFVAQMYENEYNSPEKRYAREQEALQKKAPDRYEDVDSIYQELYKRGASQSELDHFGKMLASGEVDPYELRSFIMAQPEYQKGEDEKFRAGVADELGKYDQDVFNREKENVISRYSQAGRLNSSSLDYALTDLMGKISQERSKYLAGLSASQYQGNKALARADYETTLDRLFSEQDYGRNRSDTLNDMMTNRLFGLNDYNMEADAYARAMGAGKKRGSGLGAGIGSVIGGGIGAFYGGPAGYTVGSGIGGAAGGAFDYWNS